MNVRVVPELRTLPGDALAIWSDAVVRRGALEDIVIAWEQGSPDLARCVGRVDDAVVAGLRALGLPRGAVRGVHAQPVGRGWAGRKYADSRLVFDVDVMRVVVRVRRQADDYLRTWVHESLHARQPFSPRSADETTAWQGYEEGMVEGLARLVVRDKAGMQPLELSYAYYVAAYRALAAVTGTDAEATWRALWEHRTGDVRASFVGVVHEVRQRATAQSLVAAQRDRLQAVADQLFSSARLNYQADKDMMERLWRIALL